MATTIDVARMAWQSVNLDEHPDRFEVLLAGDEPATRGPRVGDLIVEECRVAREILTVRLPEGWTAGETRYGDRRLWDGEGACRVITSERRGCLVTVLADGGGHPVSLKVVSRRSA